MDDDGCLVGCSPELFPRMSECHGLCRLFRPGTGPRRESLRRRLVIVAGRLRKTVGRSLRCAAGVVGGLGRRSLQGRPLSTDPARRPSAFVPPKPAPFLDLQIQNFTADARSSPCFKTERMSHFDSALINYSFSADVSTLFKTFSQW